MKLYPFKTTKIGRNKITYLENENNKSSYPILLIPGWPVSCYSFVPLMNELNSHLKCYAVNLPGYGSSKTKSKAFQGFKYHTKFINKFHRKIIKAKKFNIFGYSSGGAHALDYALKFPENLSKLMVYSPTYDASKQLKKTLRQSKKVKKLYNIFKRNPILFTLLRPKLVKSLIAKWRIETFYKNVYPELMKSDKKFMNIFLKDTIEANLKKTFDLVLDMVDHKGYDKLVNKITNETLILSGEKDRAVSPKLSEKFAKSFPNSVFVTIPNSRHDAVISNPKQVAESMVKFLQE